jgi:hypothetical protein
MLLLSPVMRHLELDFNRDTYNPTLAEDCLSVIANQAHSLRVLKISLEGNMYRRRYPEDYFDIPPPFAVLASLEELEYLGFPPNWASCSLLRVLSSLPKLRLLDFQYDAKLSFDTHRPLARSRACTRIASSNSGETTTTAKPSTRSLAPTQDDGFPENLSFRSLQTLELEASFLNFYVEDFDLEVAARYISSLFAVTSDSMSVPTPPVANQCHHPAITLFDSGDKTLPLTMAEMLSYNDGTIEYIEDSGRICKSEKTWKDRWAVVAGYHEEYLEFQREFSMDVFGRLDARAHQNTQAYEEDRTDEPRNRCPFCSKLKQLEEKFSCWDSDLDTDTDCSWDSSDNSGDESDESIV